MREIKFRAWDKDRKVMANVSNIDFLTGQVQMNAGGMHSERVSGDKVILLQYTDLKDKNGVEIYDGSIIRFILGDYNIREYVEEVVYSDGAFWCGNWLLFDAKVNDDDLEVLGNIYENPELLEREAE